MNYTVPGKTASLSEIMEFLERAGGPQNVAGMARYGIRPAKAYGVPSPVLRQLARSLGKNTALATRLWDTGVHDARFLGALVANPKDITSEELDRWAHMFDSWALCDSTCIQLIRKTPHAWAKVKQWSKSEEEFVRRASIALLATLAVHDKKSPQSRFDEGRRMLADLSTDRRPLIQKAIKWAVRSMDARLLKLRTATQRAPQTSPV
ncbi:MAG: DNA alkylation repair protein [Bryobacterales bacterium]|nr:DNA alkylation repair protein [Bryobacterales bacterium]